MNMERDLIIQNQTNARIPKMPLTRRDLVNRGLIVLFILVLLTPLTVMELQVLPTKNYENRMLAEKPTVFDPLDGWTFFCGYETYLNDHFAFKNSLVALNSAYKGLLHTSASDQVVLGKSGWLFYTSLDYPSSDPIGSFMGLNRFQDDQLELLAAKFSAFDQKLKDDGIAFYLVIPPNKHTVYPEMLPKSIRKNAAETRMNQLIAYLREHTDVAVIDVSAPLLREQAHHQVYYKTDTHWNSYGAYIAYTEILNTLGLSPNTPADYVISPREVQGMDMARMAGAVGTKDLEYDFVLKNPGPAPTLIDGVFDSDKLAVYSNHDPSAPSLMIYHDSYNVALMPFLTPHFSRTISKWSLFPSVREVVELAPDYVVFEVLERNLEHLFAEDCLRPF